MEKIAGDRKKKKCGKKGRNGRRGGIISKEREIGRKEIEREEME